jgi:adenylosuccinate lyase
MALETAFAAELGLAEPYPDDWHGARDVFADYAMTWALISKSLGRIGNELFLLQMTDIGETEEVRPATTVGSSTMPHKKNPSKPEALVHYSRTIPRLAEVLLDDMINVFERDNTSRPNRIPGELSQQAAAMLRTAINLLDDLRVNEAAMRRNLDRTNGLIMAQRVTFALAEPMGKSTANEAMHEIALHAVAEGITLREAIRDFPEVSRHLSDEDLDELLDAASYTGLAAEQVDAVIAWCEAERQRARAAQ